MHLTILIDHIEVEIEKLSKSKSKPSSHLPGE
jgi:hypothetical protein